MYLHGSPSVSGTGGAAGRARNLLYVEESQRLTQLVRDTNDRRFPEYTEQELNPCPKCNVLLLRARKTSMSVPRY